MIKRKRAMGGLLTLAVAAGVAVGAAPQDEVPRQNTSATVTPADSATRTSDHDRLRALLRRLTTVDGGPGALVEMRDRRGSVVLTSGVADVTSHAPIHRGSRFRIGSMTKTFVATVLLQLVGERRVVLDAPVERYLPGVVRGHGNDGRVVTVRQLLQHTSGIPDVLDHLSPREILEDPLAHHDMRDLVDIALAHPPTFEPGTGWRYSNTGYLLAGMIIEKVTGHSYRDEIRRRVIAPLGLRETYLPGDSSAIPGPHPRGYARPGEDAPLRDITAINPSVGGPAAEMISSGTDVNRFLDALLRGRLLRPAELREMMRTRPTGNPDGRAYGLGLESRPLPCGGLYWGHTGDFPGFETAGGATLDGRQATVMVNLGPGGPDAQSADMRSAVRTALCAGRSRDQGTR
ncbi:serine hydrolase domain-containing protein [Streptomyces viridochromogenes]|uniref:serine hydrolase domain-containing protein n=1 Tax=Streptomyces viridochromogenes TaxID=1938 RepID=UPI00069D84B1|nr:serine hydrolase domain-containing protein [Streptomyces viridochromogenes]KOG23234.1 D-alanyl-D-alanine carboxypeptidase [Streptomyces viridochromogenes]KOG27162.1 D-alanyl-D-alanine carboxypeptidase [Streptomyces viridochromogenes]